MTDRTTEEARKAMLIRAAELLRQEATAIKDSHTLDGDWAGECEAKSAHDEMLNVAAALQWQAEQQKGEARWWIVEWRSNTTGGVLRTTRPMRTEHEALAAKADLERGYISEHFTYVVTPLFASPHGVPPGYVLVPVEPTEEMIEAAKGGNVVPPHLEAFFRRGLLGNWRDMLSSLPQAPQEEQWTCPKCGVERYGPLIACKQDGCPSAPPPLAQGDSQ